MSQVDTEKFDDLKVIMIVAPLLSKSGYGTHARSIANALIRNKMAHVIVGMTHWGSTADYDASELELGPLYVTRAEVGKQFIESKQVSSVSLQVCLPDEFKPEIAHFNILSTAAVESDKIPEAWVGKINQADLVHVPSSFTKNVLVSNGCEEHKIHVIPLVVGLEYDTSEQFSSDLDQILEPFSKAVLTAGAWQVQTPLYQDRKALDETIKCFMLAYAGKQDTVLLVKSHAIDPDDPRDIDLCASRIMHIANDVGLQPDQTPPIRLVHGHLDSNQMASLFSHDKVETFASATHGEGFGLLIAEAWQRGLNVVATGWSGHLDYLTSVDKKGRRKNKAGFFGVKNELVELPPSFKHLPWAHEDGKWSQADQDDFIKKLRASVDQGIKKGRNKQSLIRQADHTYQMVRATQQFLEQVPAPVQNVETMASMLEILLEEFYETDIVVLSDLLPDQGRGAEKTLNQLLTVVGEASKAKIVWMQVNDIMKPDRGPIANGALIIIANASSAAPDVWQWISATKQRFILAEFDYRWAQHRNPALADLDPQFDGNYPPQVVQVWREIYGTAEQVWFMSARQKDVTEQFIGGRLVNSHVVGSYVSDLEPKGIKKRPQRRGFAFWNSKDPLKGANQARKFIAQDPTRTPIPFDGLMTKQLKRLLSVCESLVLLPIGLDTDPRLVYEALVCGASVITNRHVQTDFTALGCTVEQDLETGLIKISPPEPQSLINEMESRVGHALQLVDKALQAQPKPTISLYTTTWNCIANGYPFIKSIESMLDFCQEGDEVCVADLGSDDETMLLLTALKHHNKDKLKIAEINVDRTKANWAIDMHKTDARQMCEGDVLIQFDVDEVLPKLAHVGWRKICGRIFNGPAVLTVPMIEFWGSDTKIRKDYDPFKPRISRRESNLVHAAPQETLWEKDGVTFIKNGQADGCEYMTGDFQHRALVVGPAWIPIIDQWGAIDRGLLMQAIAKGAKRWSVNHLSWLDIDKKLKQYRSTWDQHHRSRYGLQDVHNAHFPGIKWTDVTDDMIAERAVKLAEQGSRVFHSEQKVERLTQAVSLN